MRRSVARLTILAVLVPLAAPCVADEGGAPGARKVVKTDREWAKQLTPAQYFVCRQKGTEPAFTGRYVHNKTPGTYACVGCGAPLFSSLAKFESGTGWPSFWRPIEAEAVDQEMDYRSGVARVEVMCRDCGSHLGHVFNDGPAPTGLRYCINSVALKFVPAAKATTKAKAKAKPAPKGEAEPMPEPEVPTGQAGGSGQSTDK